MSQYAFSGNTIINQSFPDTRTALNAAYAALASNSSGDNDPTSVAGGSLATVQHQWWYDSTNNKLMLRNDANNAWIEIATIDETSGNVLSITTQGLTIGATALTATGTEINQLSAITRGSILYGDASGATARLAAGGVDTVLTSDGTDISWAAASSGGGGSRTLLQTVTASSDPTVLIGSSSLLSSTYRRYEILVENVVATTTIIGRVSIGGAVKTTANYLYGLLNMSSRFGFASSKSSVSGGASSITLMNTTSFPTGASYNSTITLFDPSNTNLAKQIISSGIMLTDASSFNLTQCLSYAAYMDGTAAIDGFQFSTASGSIVSGTFKLYGIT